MRLSAEQIEAVVASALPGSRLREAQPLGGGRAALRLAGGETFDLHTFEAPDAAATAVAALRRLRAEVDLPLPQIQASDAAGELVGVPWLLALPLGGAPLAQAIGRIDDESLRQVGRQLGQAAYRVHRLACAHYGPLAAEGGPADEGEFVRARLEDMLAAAAAQGLLAEGAADSLREWFGARFSPVPGPAALLAGGLSPETILVRQERGGWALSGILGWERAQGWTPAWEHAALLDAARARAHFALRVGYGNAYDDQTPRVYEQVREAVLRPYRILLALEQAIRADAAGDDAERERCGRMMDALARFEH